MTAAIVPTRPFAHRGVLIGLLVLGVENGLPFVDTAQHYAFGYAISNYLVLALIFVLAARIPRAERKPGVAALAAVGYLFTIWWLVTVWHSGGEPLSAAMASGRNFLLFALLAVLFPLGLSDRRERWELIATVCAGALLYSVGEVVITLSHHPLPWLVHPVAIRTSDVGLQRVYAFMGDSAVLVFCLSIGATVLGQTRRLRRWGSVAAGVSAFAIILQQTRAVYLTLPVALIIVLVWWIMCAPAVAGRLARRAGAVTLFVATLLAVLAVAAPTVITTYAGTPLSRLSGAFVQFSAGTGNLGARFQLAHNLLALLHGQPLTWATGLGFLDPKYHYFATVPLGTIQNSDLGLVDGIMLIGLVGVVLTYLVVLIPLRRLAAEARTRDMPSASAWLIFGLAVWLVQVLLASYTLSTLWLQPGQVLVAMVAGLVLHTCRERQRTPYKALVHGPAATQPQPSGLGQTDRHRYTRPVRRAGLDY